MAEPRYIFDRFALSGRVLTRDGRPVRLGGRATSLLLALVGKAGELVSKDELIAAAWAQDAVEEGNLRVHLTALRRALGDSTESPRFIANVTGRGYRFVAPVALEPETTLDASRFVRETAPFRLPMFSASTTILGRDVEMQIIEDNLRRAPLVTVVGPGGVGKTTAAIAASHRVRDVFADGIYFVDLAAVSDPANVPFAVASTLELSVDTHAPRDSLVSQLAGKRLLLVFDNCEHVIEEAARTAEAITRAARGVAILATSHEPLLTEGETTVRLMPFPIPGRDLGLSLAAAMTYPAIQLFVEHAIAHDDALVVGEGDVNDLIDICRKLDGLPLAIEIAAARAGALGLRELNARLDDRFGLLTGGRRTAAARHQTLRSLLDWSYGYLSSADQSVLRRLSVFPGDFTVDAAIAIAAGDHIDRREATDTIDRLLRRSLIATGSPGVPWLRLPESTRIYLAAQLTLAGETRSAHSAHARHLCAALRTAEEAWAGSETRDWLGRYGSLIDESRAALDWAWSEQGDAALGVTVTTLSMYLAFQLGQVEEFYERGLLALRRAETLPVPQPLDELRLHIACQTFAYVRKQPYAHHLKRIAELAEIVGTARARVEAGIAHANANLTSGRYAEALVHCEAALVDARADGELAVLAVEKVMAQVHHFLGNQPRTVALASKVLRHPTTQIPLNYGFMHADRRVSMRVMLARALWLTGHADGALRVADEARSYAHESDMVTGCQILALAEIPILLWRGDRELAAPKVRQLREQAVRFGFKEYQMWADSFDRALGNADAPKRLDLSCLPDQQLVTFGGADTAELEIAGTNWSTAELLRVRGQAELRRGHRDQGLASLNTALDLARQQGVIAWELRCALSLGRHARSSPDQEVAMAHLDEILARLPEGHQAADPLAAHRMLAELRDTQMQTSRSGN